MNNKSGLIIGILVLLFACSLIAGCTNSAPEDTSTVQQSTTAITPSVTALYSVGDIVRSPKTDSGTGWLILKYDPGTETYERAFIYKNNDGSWGYRVDSRTETLDRLVLEKVNTVKVTTVDASQIPLREPTATTATVTAAAISSVSTTSNPVTTQVTSQKPQIKGITPESGSAGTSVLITDLWGDSFQNGASVMLVKDSNPNISAINVNFLSATHMTCTFPLPINATIGIWDLVVINKDGQSARYSNGFTVRTNPSATATTTTSTTGGVTITSIDPTSAFSGDYKQVTIYGTNFKDGITGKLTRSGYADIPAATVSRNSDTKMQCFFSIPSGSAGPWNLILTNTDGTSGTYSGFTVNY